MYSFTGNTESKVDAKGRVSVPAAYRKQLAEKCETQLVARIEKYDNYSLLTVFPQSVWEEILKGVQSKLNMHDKNDRFFFMNYTRLIFTLDIDCNGRVLIPKACQKQINLGDEVEISGCLDRFSIAPKDTVQYMDFEQLADEEQDRFGNK
ncbi:MAG: hypothetical protein LBN27_04335 [Prevotellaceae bacterium]|jgi:MraZ protein|nr:hypothetical protein [Prevotellaceae bacterium]